MPVEGAPPPVPEGTDPSIRAVAATLIVENERMLDYRIYLTRQGSERTARFRIMPNDASLIVDPLPEVKDSTEADSTKADSTRKPPRR